MGVFSKGKDMLVLPMCWRDFISNDCINVSDIISYLFIKYD